MTGIGNSNMEMSVHKDKDQVTFVFEYSEEMASEITNDVFFHLAKIVTEMNKQNIKYTKIEISNIIDRFDTFYQKVLVNILLEPYSFPIFLMKYHGK